ncbi:hypothetical protein CBR_g8127 [Chara braunii]|uniref:Protein kinase domain-containing protein n=1 Tax=Chara braunii TaxID=69332 RepID=A0A388KLB5_CHABU|nr:hypothetical protein CBR_g8127 [Chara braunii]|eukprot:GBG70827.1 hypothetical protein CBR_g8127 [Chara braunii]
MPNVVRTLQIDVHPHEPWVLCTRTNYCLIQVWNYEDGTQVASGEVQEAVGDAKFLMQRDCQWIVVQNYSRRRFDIYELKSSNWQHITRVEQSPASKLVYGSMAVRESLPYILTFNEYDVILLDWRESRDEIKLMHHRGKVTAVAFHPIESGIFAIARDDSTITIWDLGSMSIVRRFYTERNSIVTMVEFCGRFSKKSLLITAHSSKSEYLPTPAIVSVIDFRRGVCLAKLTGHSRDVKSAFLHPRLPYLFSASSDGEIRVWSERDYQLVASYVCESSFLEGMALCRQSDLLIVAGREKFSVMEVEEGRKTWASETRMEDREKEAAHAKLDLETKIRNVVAEMELKRKSEIIDDLRAQRKEEERTQAERVMKLESAVTGLKAAVQSLEAEGTSIKDERAALLEKLARSELELETRIGDVVRKMKVKCKSEIIDDLRAQHQEEERGQAERVWKLESVVNSLKALVQSLEAEGTSMKDERAALFDKLEKTKMECERVIEELTANHQPKEKAQKERQQPLGTEADTSGTGAEELKTVQVVETKLEMSVRRAEQLECERAEVNERLEKSEKRIEKLENKMEAEAAELKAAAEKLECERAELLEKLEKSDKRIEKLAQRFAEELSLQEPLREYSLREVRDATNNFDASNKCGSGSHEGSCLYRGKLCDGTMVLVKKSGTLSCMQEMHSAKFKTEVVDILHTLHHPHLLTLLGVCYGGGCLVFEHMRNGSVKEQIGNAENTVPGFMPSHVRFRTMVDAARAVHFLHSSRLANGSPIIHCAIKPENIFLDDNFVAKIGDIDQALLVPEKCVQQKSTKGSEDEGSHSTFLFLQANAQYVAPELWQSQVFDEKTDVYALGVTILEMLTGKFGRAIGVIQCAMEEGEEDAVAFEKALDHNAGAWNVELAKEVAKLGLRCVSLDRHNRPNMMEEGVGILPVLGGVALKVVVAEAVEVNEKL